MTQAEFHGALKKLDLKDGDVVLVTTPEAREELQRFVGDRVALKIAGLPLPPMPEVTFLNCPGGFETVPVAVLQELMLRKIAKDSDL